MLGCIKRAGYGAAAQPFRLMVQKHFPRGTKLQKTHQQVVAGVQTQTEANGHGCFEVSED